jgi:hypothetical protein
VGERWWDDEWLKRMSRLAEPGYVNFQLVGREGDLGAQASLSSFPTDASNGKPELISRAAG